VFILVVFLVAGLGLMLWAMIEEYARSTATAASSTTDNIIIIEGKVRHKSK
jgi:hypothetical protein